MPGGGTAASRLFSMVKRIIVGLAVLAAILVGVTGCRFANETGTEPVAVAVAIPSSGAPPLLVTFDATHSENAVRYEWDFGDGETDKGIVVSHVYTDEGDYTATLTAYGPTGEADTAEVSISVHFMAPVAVMHLEGEFSGEGAEFYSAEMITFDASGSFDPDGAVVSYYWDFGDGTTADGEVVHHYYMGPSCCGEPLQYVVTLTVEDDDGLKASTSAIVTIKGRCQR